MAYLIPQFWANSCCIAFVTHKEPLATFPKCFSILSKYPNFVLLAQFTNQMLNTRSFITYEDEQITNDTKRQNDYFSQETMLEEYIRSYANL